MMKFFKLKHEGSLIVMTMILGFTMLSLALTAVNVLLSDVEVLEDFIGSEKAYYAAESGMELALLALQNEPVDYAFDDVEIISDSQQVSIDIPNQVPDLNVPGSTNSFQFIIPEFGSKKFRLKSDQDASLFNHSLSAIRNFNVKIEKDGGGSYIAHDPNNPYQRSDQISWKIACSQRVNNPLRNNISGYFERTISIQNVQDIQGALPNNFTALTGVDMQGVEGRYDVYSRDFPNLLKSGTALVADFFNNSLVISSSPVNPIIFVDGLSDEEVQSCFVSFTNNATDDLVITISSVGGGVVPNMSPESVTIRSKGEAGGREKIIEFKYFQKNLGELFDFVFFHTSN